MQHVYGWSWNAKLRQLIDELTEDQARTRFDEGPQLGVVALPQPDAVPLYALTLSAGAADVRVHRYDARGSQTASLDYTVLDGRLFLEQAGEWLYPEDDRYHAFGGALAHRTFEFQPSGVVRLSSRVKETGVETVEEFSDVDVSGHWIDPLAWGDWDRVGRYDPPAVSGSRD